MQRSSALSMSPAATAFLAENHLCTFTSIRPDGSPHVSPVRFTWDPQSGLARIMTVGGRTKVRNVQARAGARVALCQTDGPRWLTLEGVASVSDNPSRISEGVARYAQRYRSRPPAMPGLVVIEIAVDRIMGLY
ncbi:pyridoxamine 5'-phosphate oxidase family protein [Streptomyces sp. HPF1205]|uniref:pyridoxamine 5'-phosphate oxidase family protein n=1 Tax=Streptomyces sp. HPF1205 TaxID=2873262 RepID=UPI001CEC95F8|nr:TIGR03618 family F420-dependent PPOX class oxidoreductase [Streptomyces sp. HPF1205]